jgi:class 3 adenylate cyclase
MVDRTGRTIIASTVFIDIVGYSKVPISRQMAMKTRLNDIIAESVSRIAESERVILDTGDGAALCFVGDPEDALFVATAITDAVRKEYGEAAQILRTGVHLGPVKVVNDINGQPNIIGDGINVAQRVMSFAGDDEILVSRAYFEVVARLKDGNENLFRYVGVKKDKHIREHQIYTLSPHAATGREGAVDTESGPAAAVPAVGPIGPLTTELLASEEHRLADRIGPLARVIVRRAAESAGTIGEFYAVIAATIPDAADRAAFLAAAPAQATPEAADGPAAGATMDAPRAALGALSDDDLATAESRLARNVGPLAKILVKKAAARAKSIEDFYAILAEHIADQSERTRFLASAKSDH